MEVPDHIYVAGAPRMPGGRRNRSHGPFRRQVVSLHENGSNDGEVEAMQVPERIVVGGGGVLVADKPRAVDSLRDWPLLSKERNNVQLGEVPPVLTAADVKTSRAEPVSPREQGNPTVSLLSMWNSATSPFPSASQFQDRAWSQGSSIAVEENPLRELKIMRRALGSTNTRLLELEDEGRRRNGREMWLWIGLLSLFVLEAWRAVRRFK